MGKPMEAIACYQRAIQLRPACRCAHYSVGVAWETIGDMSAAAAGYRAAVRHDPVMAIAHYKLATLLGKDLPEEDLAALRSSLQRGDLTDDQRKYLHFGLAYVYDDRGEYAEAAQHLESANALQLAASATGGRPYDAREHSLLIDRLISCCTPDFFRRVAGFGLASELPVFVVGLPRSGTTLVEQILGGHSQVFGAGEIHLAVETANVIASRATGTADAVDGLVRLDQPTVAMLASQHLQKLRARAPAAQRIVDKMLDNYTLLALLACLFPRAKIIHCRRDLRDVAVSCWMTHFKEVRWANDRQHIASRFRDYLRLMEHWRKVLPIPMLEVDYEETVADLEGTARNIVAWCGLDWEPACVEFHRTKRPVSTASAVQVRRPIYPTSVARWRHYEDSLATLLSAIPAGK